MLHVKRAGHSTLTTPDIGRLVDYFTRTVGLSLIAREKDRAILATKSGLEAIALERGDAAGASRLSFQIAPGSDLAEVAAQLDEAGIKSERRHDITPGIRQALAYARSDVVPPLALDASLVQLRGDLGKIAAGCDLERQPRGAGGIAALESDRLQSGFGGEDCAILFARDQA